MSSSSKNMSDTNNGTAQHSRQNCVFCRIIKGEIPAVKLIETPTVLSFLDAFPLSRGHLLVIPKVHHEKFHQLDENTAADVARVLSRLAKAVNVENYNLLQNNGKIAHQVVPHVHFHLIPKLPAENHSGAAIAPRDSDFDIDNTPHRGLRMDWDSSPGDPVLLRRIADEIMSNVSSAEGQQFQQVRINRFVTQSHYHAFSSEVVHAEGKFTHHEKDRRSSLWGLLPLTLFVGLPLVVYAQKRRKRL